MLIVVAVGFLYEFYRRARGGDSFLRSLFWDLTTIRNLRLDDPERVDDRPPSDQEA